MKTLMLTNLLTLGLAQAGGAQAPASLSLSARAVILDTAGQERGTARLIQTNSGLQMTVEVRGLTPGAHGVHVHEFGRCAPGVDPATNTTVPFGGAGGHFDPGASKNHDSPITPNQLGHGGDLPMLQAGADGVARFTVFTDKLSLTGVNSVLNRSLVIHAKPDDFKTDPAGLTGAREQCGVIKRENFTVRDYTLPGPQDFPEGVAVDARRGLIYTGSAANGTIYAVNASSGAVSKFQEGGAKGRASALGLKVDALGRLWVAGGAQGTVSLLSPDGMTIKVLETPPSPHTYINDLVLVAGSTYVTDSYRPVIYRVTPSLTLEPWLDLTKTPIRYAPGINLNGIVATPDGRYLLSVQLNTGDLWRIDLSTKAVRRVMTGLQNGDGLLLDGHSLYVARNKDGVISKVRLDQHYASGRIEMQEPLTGLRFPTTLSALGEDLIIVQGQLDKLQGGTAETPFKLTRFRRF